MMANTPRIADFLSNSRTGYTVELENSLSTHTAWKAFQSGMQMLQRYACRSTVDVHAIAKSNLQLLHRSLSHNTQYSAEIEAISLDGTHCGLPTIRRLYSEQGLTADLMTLQSGASINLVTLPQRYSMYLLISGTAQLNDEPSKTINQSWWNPISSIGNRNHLRSGSVVIRMDTLEKKRLTAKKKNCLLLRVHTPTQETPVLKAS